MSSLTLMKIRSQLSAWFAKVYRRILRDLCHAEDIYYKSAADISTDSQTKLSTSDADFQSHIYLEHTFYEQWKPIKKNSLHQNHFLQPNDTVPCAQLKTVPWGPVLQ